MTVNWTAERNIELSGACSLEEAEQLFQYLSENPAAVVDWSSCEQAHTAVIQVILASGCVLQGDPVGDFLRLIIKPAFLRAKQPNSVFPG
jgi:hypothetical protein